MAMDGRPSNRSVRRILWYLVAILSIAVTFVPLAGAWTVRPIVDTRFRRRGVTLSASPSHSLRVVSGLQEIVHDYDVWLLDMWGVLHDGTQPYAGVLEAMAQLKASGNTRLVILSNSSKRKEHSVRMLQTLGFRVEDFDDIISSGEVAWTLLHDACVTTARPTDASIDSALVHLLASIPPSKRNIFLLGSGDDDVDYITSAGWHVTSVDDASLVLARGTVTIQEGVSTVIHKGDSPEQYHAVLTDRLTTAARRRLPLVVTNPDKIRPDADRSPMPGAIGDLYRHMLSRDGSEPDHGQLVHCIGKPFPLVYQHALGHDTNTARVCMVGDALETDVTGGSALQMDTIWVVDNGIYRGQGCIQDDHNDLGARARRILDIFHATPDTYAAGRHVTPTVVMPYFQW